MMQLYSFVVVDPALVNTLFKVVNVNCFSNKITYRKKVYCKSDAYAVQFVVMDLNYIDCSYVQNHMLAEFF